MSRRSTKRVVAQPAPVKLSEWAKQAGRPVTRAECLNVIYLLVERRFLVEQEIKRQRLWRVRFWRWMTEFFTARRGPTEAEIEHARRAALDPQAGAGAVDEPELEETGKEHPMETAGQQHEEEAFEELKEQPPEELESGVRFRDRRRGR